MNVKISSSLHAPLVTLLLLLIGFGGCKKGGGGITDPIEPPVDEPKMTISFESENTSFLPGEFIRLVISNATLDEDLYKATIDNSLDIELPLYEDEKNNQGLIFIIPEIEVGSHTLHFNKVGIDTTLAFSIDNYEPIDNPDQYVEDFLVESKSSLEHLIEAATSEGIKDTLQTMLTEIDEAVSSMDQLSEEDRKLIARFLETNLESNQSASKQKFSAQIESCEQRMELITPDMAVLVTTIASWGYATYLASTISWTGWGAVASGVFLSASGAAILIKLTDTLNRREDLINSCFEPFEIWLDETFKAKESGIPFEHGKAKSFNISSEYDLPQTVYSLLGELKDIYIKVQSIIPDSWMEKASELDYKEVRPENPAGFNVDAISDERILGTAAENGDQLAITLEYQKGVILDGENNPFTFELMKDGYNKSIVEEATLKPLKPISYDEQVIIAEDSTAVSDTLEADYAADFIIETPPSNGTVTLDNVFTGEFTYQANEGYTGEDSFTFSASNSSGNSESAVVTIKGTDTHKYPEHFVGNWKVWSTTGYETSRPPTEYDCYEEIVKTIDGKTWYFRYYSVFYTDVTLYEDGNSKWFHFGKNCSDLSPHETTYYGWWGVRDNLLYVDTDGYFGEIQLKGINEEKTTYEYLIWGTNLPAIVKWIKQ